MQSLSFTCSLQTPHKCAPGPKTHRKQGAQHLMGCRAWSGGEKPKGGDNQIPPYLLDLEKELGRHVVRVVHEEEDEFDIDDEEEDWDEVASPMLGEDFKDNKDGQAAQGSPFSAARHDSCRNDDSALPQPPAFPHIVGAEQLQELQFQIPGLIVLNVHSDDELGFHVQG